MLVRWTLNDALQSQSYAFFSTMNEKQSQECRNVFEIIQKNRNVDKKRRMLLLTLLKPFACGVHDTKHTHIVYSRG